MIHLLKSASARVLTYGLATLIVVGLLLGAVRLALPFADLFRSQLEVLLSETLHLDVRVGRFDIRLAGWVPRVDLSDAQLLDPKTGHIQLSLKQLRVNLDLLASVRELAPKIDSVTLVGAHLVVRRLEDGSLGLAGLEAVEAGDPEAVTFFLSNGRFLLTESDVYWTDPLSGERLVHLSNVRMRLDNTDERHLINVSAHLPGDADNRLRLVGDLRGAPDEPATWQGRVYLHWQGRGPAPVLEHWLPSDLRLASSMVEIESWNDWEGAGVARSLNRVSIGGLLAGKGSAGGAGAALSLEGVRALVRWRPRPDGWQLDVADLSFTRDGVERPATDLGLRFREGVGDGDWTLSGGAGLLDLQDLGALLPLLPGELSEMTGAVTDRRIEGDLRDLRFRFAQSPRHPPRWVVAGSLRGLNLDPSGRIPGLEGLSADIRVSEDRGSLTIDSDGLVLSLPRLLRSPFALDRVLGQLHWWLDAGGALHVHAPEITADNSDIRTASRLSLTVPPGGGSPFLDLQTEFGDADAAAVRRYLPVGILKERLARWLDRAFVGGTVPSGTLLFRGTIDHFPFTGQEGRFEILFGVKDAILDYHADWPRLEGVTAEVRFLNSSLEINDVEGRLLQSEILAASARIPNLIAADAVEIEGTVAGPFEDDLRILVDTPLRKRFGPLAKALRVNGASRLNLHLALPLPRKGGKLPLRLRGELSWPAPASLAVGEWDLELKALTGNLVFTEGTLSAESIQARLWGVPVRIRIDKQGGAVAVPGSTRIRLDSRLPTRVLAQRFPTQLWELIQGDARWDLSLNIRDADLGRAPLPLGLVLESDLRGLAVDLPEPLGKGASETRGLRLESRLVANAKVVGVRGGYGDLDFDLGFRRDEAGRLGLRRGTLNIGAGDKALPRGDGLHLTGSFDTLDLPAWLNRLGSLNQGGGGGSSGGLALRSADLRVKHLLLTDLACNAVHIDLERGRSEWHARLSAQELEGEVFVPRRHRSEPIRIHLDRLDLKALLSSEGGAGHSLTGEARRSDPLKAHTLDLQVEDLLWGDNPLGGVTVRSQPSPDGLRFTDLDLEGPLMSIQGEASWTREGDGQRSRLSLEAKGPDLGEFLRRLEYQSLFHKAPAQAELALEWPGGPAQFTVAHLRGRVELDVGAGSLLEVDPGVGRVLGVLNLGALQRRLSLDFSDLFGRGYAFEKISGALDVRDGEAVIERLVMEGPSSEVNVAGSTDLVKRRFDQVVTVTPRIGTSVAVAGAVAGGPLVGAAVLLADQVSGGAVDRLGQHQYRISGPWEAPEIRRGGEEGEATQSDQVLFVPGQDRAGAENPPSEKPRSPRSGRRDGSPRVPPGRKEVGKVESSDDNLFLEEH